MRILSSLMLVWLRERLCERRRKLEEINAFFYHVDWLKRLCGCFEVVVDGEGFATTTSWMFRAELV